MIFTKIYKFQSIGPQTKNNELTEKVLDNVRDLFNDLYYIFKERYEEEKDDLNRKSKKIDSTKLRLADDYQHDSEEEQKGTDKKEPPQKSEITDT